MKKRMSKLHLHRETIRSLQSWELHRAAGGYEPTTGQCDEGTHCDCESYGCYEPTMCFGTCSCSWQPC
jgi:hypothetical protein